MNLGLLRPRIYTISVHTLFIMVGLLRPWIIIKQTNNTKFELTMAMVRK